MTRNETLDAYFMEARCRLIEVAAFMDRVERADGPADFRWAAFHEALQALSPAGNGRAERVLMAFSDPTDEPLPEAPGKGACGAWPGAVPGTAD